MSIKFKKWLLAGSTVGLLLLGLLQLADQHEVKAQQQIELTFAHEQNQLAGTLLLPAGQGPFPVVLLVHGDGPQTRGIEHYTQIINAYLAAGIACFSWDKPGTGHSSGDWLQQSMRQRAQEAHAAMQMLAQRQDIQAQRIGLLGFSQGGWVLPEVAAMSPAPAFLITVGAALDWRSQSEFFTRQRLTRAGASAAEIEKTLEWQSAAPQPSLSLSFNEYREQLYKYAVRFPAPGGAYSEALSAKRYHFIALNIDANSSKQLAKLQSPLLAIWGEDDLNVDAKTNEQAFAKLLNVKHQSKHRVVLVPQADHTMLNSANFSMQLPSEWTGWMSLQYFIAADEAFAPEFLSLIVDWAKQPVH